MSSLTNAVILTVVKLHTFLENKIISTHGFSPIWSIISSRYSCDGFSTPKESAIRLDASSKFTNPGSPSICIISKTKSMNSESGFRVNAIELLLILR